MAPLSMRGTLRAERRSDHPQASPFRRGHAGDVFDDTLGMDGAFGHIRLRRVDPFSIGGTGLATGRDTRQR
jgi:hypothetical protein